MTAVAENVAYTAVVSEPDSRHRHKMSFNKHQHLSFRKSEAVVESGSDADPDELSVEEDDHGRKRRRSRKGLDKKFGCPHEGCGKSYSRAEHLYRHQLNHAPKQIYKCDFAGCDRIFVRQDLCVRHRERHTAKGSQLQRKDAIKRNSLEASLSSRNANRQENANPAAQEPRHDRDLSTTRQQHDDNLSPLSPTTQRRSFQISGGTSAMASDFVSQTKMQNLSSGNDSGLLGSYGQGLNANVAIDVAAQQNSGFGVSAGGGGLTHENRPNLQAAMNAYSLHHQSPNGSPYIGQQHAVQSHTIPQNFETLTLPPSSFPTSTPTTIQHAEAAYAALPQQGMNTMTYQNDNSSFNQTSGPEMMVLDEMSTPNTMPVFGGESYNRSPFAISDDFVAYLFSGQQFNGSGAITIGQPNFISYMDNPNQYQPYYANEAMLGGYYPHTLQHPMAVESLLDTSPPEGILSEEKSQEIVDLITNRFNETEHAPMTNQKSRLLEGNRHENSHMLSRHMMQTYIGSYWTHLHPQLPILHKPTFTPDKTANSLLIAMMTLGASCLDKSHRQKVTTAGAELSNFLAWHLRWEIFADHAFRPPAKLWVFQALLLLEIFEKMYSTRALHERAHIHHATTITLMRRGSSLIGKSALDSPPSVKDDRTGPTGSRQSSTSAANSPDEWWNHWITAEATRRVAFAAFIIDSTHATMFGHSTVMVAHEMRLPLPCDETLWSANNSAEVGRLEAGLHANGVKPMTFLEGLKRTLNSQEVRTNSFGRTILMSGLLSVSWHMNQRDLQVNSLGVSPALGGRDKWRGSLTRAFDVWKQDFDKSLANGTETSPDPYTYAGMQDDKVVFESRTVLHHLAHLAMHIDIVDCQILARAKRLLGRTIGSQDLNSVQRRMRDHWAPSAKARDATYYALSFLRTVLCPSTISSSDAPFTYSAGDDNQLNRPWVLYYATLVVWSYGYALEGACAITPSPSSMTLEEHIRGARAYLRRFESAQSPEDLRNMKGFNGCGSLCFVLRRTFELTRWELLHEAANLLSNCINLLAGQM